MAQKAPEASPGRNVRPSVGLAIQQLPVMHFVAYNCLHCCDALCCLQLHCCDGLPVMHFVAYNCCTVVMHFVARHLPMMHFVA